MIRTVSTKLTLHRRRAVTQGKLATLQCPKSAEPFTVSKAALCRHSAFFRGYFMIENLDTSAVIIEDVKATILQAYVFFIHEGEIAFGDGQALGLEHASLLVDLYIFADKYDTAILRNKIIRKFWVLVGEAELSEYPWAAIKKATHSLPVSANLFKVILLHLSDGLQYEEHTEEFADRIMSCCSPVAASLLLQHFVRNPPAKKTPWPRPSYYAGDDERIMQPYLEKIEDKH